MGCWDSLCAICGAPPRGRKYIIYYNKETKEEIEDTYQYAKETEWLNKCTLLLPDGQLRHNYIEHACNIEFGPELKLKGKTPAQRRKLLKESRYDRIYASSSSEKVNIKYYPIVTFGIWMHTDCYKRKD